MLQAMRQASQLAVPRALPKRMCNVRTYVRTNEEPGLLTPQILQLRNARTSKTSLR